MPARFARSWSGAYPVIATTTGNPVAMPWRAMVEAIMRAWYYEPTGGQRISEMLAGYVNLPRYACDIKLCQLRLETGNSKREFLEGANGWS